MNFVLKERFLPGYFIFILFPRDMTFFQLIQNCLLYHYSGKEAFAIPNRTE